MGVSNKSYEELIKEQEYHDIAVLLVNNQSCRNSNAKCIKMYFKKYYGVSIDKAIEMDHLPSIFTIERKIRQLKKVNSRLCGNNANQDEFKQIALDIPIIVKVL